MTAEEKAGAIRVQGDALRGVLASLSAMVPAGYSGVLARMTWLAMLAILRPAESAMRRILAIAVLDVTLEPVRGRGRSGGARGKRGERCAALPLFDPRIDPEASLKPKHERRGRGPQFGVIGLDDFDHPARRGAPALPQEVDGASVLARVAALRDALDDIPAHARRMALLLRRRKAAAPERHICPMRPGTAPGNRARGKRDVDAVLRNCQALARRAWAEHRPP